MTPPHPSVHATGGDPEDAEVQLTASGVSPFVIYDLRHTCLTRWAKTMDPFTLMKLAGHADLNTTMRYVHLNDDDVRVAMEKREVAKGGHRIGHSAENTTSAPSSEIPVLN